MSLGEHPGPTRAKAPVLVWYHGTMAGLTEGVTQRGHLMMGARWSLVWHNGLRETEHALARWMERWGPFDNRDEAELEMLRMMADAVPVQEGRRLNGRRSGEEWWAATAGGIVRLVVIDLTVVTVLPRPGEMMEAG